MTGCSVLHDTFTVERTYLAIPSRVFAAFATIEAKSNWAFLDEAQEADGEAANAEFEFRVGGWMRSAFKRHGTTYRYDAQYYDIVPDQRIIYSYEMYAGDTRISVSVATIEFAPNGDGTALSWTEQGVFLDGVDGDAAPVLRYEGTADMIEHLTEYLNSRTPR